MPAPKIPLGAAQFLESHAICGNVLANFDWGEYLMWRTSKRGCKVFFDGRYDLVYPQSVVDDFVALATGKGDADAILDRYPHEFVLTDPGSRIDRTIAARPDRWRMIYSDPDSVLYARSNLPAASISPERGKSNAPYAFP